MKLLEQKFNTDIPNLYYTKEELEEHDKFMEKFVFPMDSWKINQSRLMMFIQSYEKLSENVKLNLKDVYIEFKTLYYKNKIESIINYRTFDKDLNYFNEYVWELNLLIWSEEVNKYLSNVRQY